MMINGRFVHAEPGGFRRYAEEVSARMTDAEIVVPPARLSRGAAGKIWEQTVLAAAARHQVLWSPATSGPIRHPRHVVTLHDVAPLADAAAVSGRFAAMQQRMLPALARSAARVVADSEVMAAEMARRFDVSCERISVVAPGVGEVFREVASLDRRVARRDLGLGRLGIDVGRPLVGGLVSSIPRKNGRAIVTTFDTIVAAGVADAVVAGWDGPGRVFGSTERPRSTLIADIGSLSDEQLALFYRALDVFVWLPSHEGFGLPVVEAAASGTAVVCSDVPSALEHLGSDVAIVAGASEAIVAVRDLLDDPERRERMGAAGPCRVADLTWQRTAAGISAAVEVVSHQDDVEFTGELT